MDLKPKSFIKRVVSFALAELEKRSPKGDVPRPEAFADRGGTQRFSYGIQPTPEQTSPQELEPRAHRIPAGLEVLRNEKGSVRVRWAVSEGELERSAPLIDEGAVLCLRLVSFDAARDHVTRDVQDRPAVAQAGEADIGRVDGRAIVSLGLRAGGRFVSIAHHVM